MRIISIFVSSVYQQHHLRSSIKFAMNKINPGTIKNNFKGTIERFFASDKAFPLLSSVKITPAYWKQFLYDEPGMVKQLGIPTYFMKLT